MREQSVPKMRVLVVDDSREVRDFVVHYILEPNGFEAVEASDGAEGVRKALQGDVDLMLLDLEMPKMNGFEVLDGLAARHSELPVILMTSHGSEAIAVEMFRKGVCNYVIKPFASDDMLEVIERALAEVRLQREKEALAARLVQTNRQLEQRLHELNAFFHIGKSITALMPLDQLLERVVDAAIYVTGAEGGAILLAEAGGGELREHLRKQRTSGEGRRLSRRSEDQLAVDAVRKGDATMTAAMLCAPLKFGNQSIGALGVSNKVTGRFFSEHDRRLLMTLADYAAVAIENARLLQQIEQIKEREKQRLRGLFERYVDPSVVEQLMARPEAAHIGGVRQTVTTLFADVRGFSDFNAHASPEVLVNVLNRYIALAVEAILSEGGTLDRFMGDAVLAYFNAPLPQPDHALRAVRAAWRLCRAVETAHQQLPQASHFLFGVGVSAGQAVVGNIGAPQMMNFTVIGDAVNLARQLQEHASGGQILVSQRVFSLVQDYVKARPVGLMQVKDRAQPEPAFEVLAVQV